MLALMFIMIIMHEFFFCIYVFNFISLQLCVSVGVGGWGSVGVGGNCVWVGIVCGGACVWVYRWGTCGSASINYCINVI